MNEEEFLAHYGVKGMRWGVRRAGKNLVTKLRKHTPSEKRKRAEAAKAKIKKMSNKQLEQRARRLELEARYKRALADSKTKSSGSKFVETFAKTPAKQAAQSFIANNLRNIIQAQFDQHVLKKR